MHWETKTFVTCIIAIFTLLRWSGTKPAISLRCACSCWTDIHRSGTNQRMVLPKLSYHLLRLVANSPRSIWRDRYKLWCNERMNYCWPHQCKPSRGGHCLPIKNAVFGGFPGGAVVENLPANAGDTGSSPGLGRSHMPWSNWAREPQLLSLRFWSLCPATREAVTVRGPHTTMKSGPCLPQLEKALAQKRRPNTAKNK